MASLSERELDLINRSAVGANRRLEREKAQRDAWHAAHKDTSLPAQPEWATVDGVDVLRVPGTSVVAEPNTGRRNAANFTVIDLKTREALCFLRKNEVRSWLVKYNES